MTRPLSKIVVTVTKCADVAELRPGSALQIEVEVFPKADPPDEIGLALTEKVGEAVYVALLKFGAAPKGKT